MSRSATRLSAVALAAALFAVLPSRAFADTRITDARPELGEDAFELRVEATEALGAPRVRTSAGFVRVWFDGVDGSRVDADGDGRVVRFVRVRPGYEDTAVTIIRIGDMRTVPEGDVEVLRDGSIARIRIPRRALPAAPSTAPVVEAAAEAAAEVADEPVAAPEPAEEASAEEPAEVATDEAVTAEASGDPLALTRAAGATPLPAPDGGSTTWGLMLLTVLLGAGYLAIRAWQKKNGLRGRARDIQIVAQKRLGARNQLVVVRALGEDHLLALHGGKAERIASLPAPEIDEDDGGGLEDTDLLPFLSLGRRGSSDADPPSTVHRERAPEPRPRFGAELMRLAGERGDRVSIDAGPSEAVAGLMRLRERLGR